MTRAVVKSAVVKSVVVDWGSTHIRVCLLDDEGQLLAQKTADKGVFNLPKNGFEDCLKQVCGDWLEDDVNVVISGMAGSRNGWIETEYLPCPVDENQLAAKLVPVENSLGLAISIVPGVSYLPTDSNYADVMRGEETQIFGVMAKTKQRDGLICLPGTHSKWARVVDGQIVSFNTFMTGELFAMLTTRSSLSDFMVEADFDEADFIAGIDCAKQQGGLLNQLFGIRARILTGLLEQNQSYGFLSGLLIGSEFVEAQKAQEQLVLVGSPSLTANYALAASHLGINSLQFDATEITVVGLNQLARLTSLNTENTPC